MVSTRQNRQTFISSALEFIAKWNFDGVDIDWEYPMGDDKANFATFMLVRNFRSPLSGAQELKAAAGSKYYITAATAADPAKIDAGLDVKKIAG